MPGYTLTFYPTTHKGHGSTKSQGHWDYLGLNAPIIMYPIVRETGTRWDILVKISRNALGYSPKMSIFSII